MNHGHTWIGLVNIRYTWMTDQENVRRPIAPRYPIELHIQKCGNIKLTGRLYVVLD